MLSSSEAASAAVRASNCTQTITDRRRWPKPATAWLKPSGAPHQLRKLTPRSSASCTSSTVSAALPRVDNPRRETGPNAPNGAVNDHGAGVSGASAFFALPPIAVLLFQLPREVFQPVHEPARLAERVLGERVHRQQRQGDRRIEVTRHRVG